ncbi:hypothetical protein PJM41_0105 [Salmonella phage vB_SenS_UTK0009]|uniref:Uncharacterized protein n=1 Tax=Salmonella phage vB_SenS_UTK0009 TaxID=3028908 RepID=A0AAF0CID1_9CAUD|nr:hypothetical protein PJM41_0105 [Salmonella phage vB_SenS_UTK0009]
MKLKPYIIVSSCGGFHLGVDSLEEAIFASTGDYSRLEGCGYPTNIGNWVETNLDVTPYNSDYEDYDELEPTLEFVYNRVLSIFEYRSPNEYADITEVAKKYLRNSYSNMSDEDLEVKAKEFV